MPASRNSKQPRSSKKAGRTDGSILAVIGVVLLLSAISAAAAWFFYSHGYLLYYGDAAAHLNIARRMIDFHDFTFKLIGTVWLPLPHVLMLPFVGDDAWWRSGLAGTFPMAACFVLAGGFLFAAARRALGSGLAGCVAALAFACNPNLLFLQSAPMTEAVFFAALCGALYFTAAYVQNRSFWMVPGAGLCVLAATLTRYEGWFLIPFVAVFFLVSAPSERIATAFTFTLIASVGAAWWLAHNWWYWGDALEFYRGPYSAKAIYQRQLAAGMQKYPGDHDWRKAVEYFRAAAQLATGLPLTLAGLAGVLAVLWKRAFWPVLLLALPPVFYVLSLHSSGTPIFVPHLWPNSYYNTRYGLAVLPLLALGAGAIVAAAPSKFRGFAAVGVLGLAISPWILYPRAENWICWKESQVNSEARREYTRQAAEFLSTHYRPGDGVFYSFGDLTAVLMQAGIPLKETLSDSREPEWQAALTRPDLFAHQRWAMAISGDSVSDGLAKARPPSPYVRVLTITVKDGPPIELYRMKTQ